MRPAPPGAPHTGPRPRGRGQRSPPIQAHAPRAAGLPAFESLRPHLLDYPSLHEPLRRFAKATHITVALSDGEQILGPVIEPQPFWALLNVDTGGAPNACPFALIDADQCRCAREAAGNPDGKEAMRRDASGLVHVAIPLPIDGEVAGVALAGQVFDGFPDRFAVERIAHLTSASPERLWELVHQCAPLSPFQLRAYVELLRTLGVAVLQARHQQLVLERRMRDAAQQSALLEAQRARLDEQDRRKDHFLALLGHEIRNPLAAIVNLAQLLESEPSRDLTDRLIRQVDQLTRLTDDLLDMSRITRGKVELQREILDLVDLARQALEPFTSSADPARQIEVTLPEPPIWVEGDRARIVQILSNLLDNATKFTEPGDRITFALEVDDREARVRVRDEGTGFDPEQADSIFEAFVQGPQLRRRPGLGIGLSLVRSLVEMHGGWVRARSPGRGLGSEFVVGLPRVPANRVRPHPSKAFVASGHRYRILVVDDEPAVADSLGDVLGRFHHVRVVYDGENALVATRSFSPDVVVSDLQMSGMDGFALARQLRAEHGSRLHLVALSGYRREVDIRRAREAGFDLLLTKPAKAADLEAALDALAGPTEEA